MRRWAVSLIVIALAGCGDSGGSNTTPPPEAEFDAARAIHDVRVQVGIGPRPEGTAASEQEVRFIALSLRQAGVGGVRIQHPYRNVVARIPGAEPGAVVLGAHHHTKDIPGFVGANDGASGVAVLLELARDLPRRVDGPSIDLAFFDGEESVGAGSRAGAFERTGDRGSGQYVRYAERGGLQGSPPLDSIRAMVLFDMVGDCDLRIPLEANSDPALYAPFADAAAASGPGGSPLPFEGTTGAIEDDHTPFLQAGVPAVDLIDFDYGPGPTPGAWWHTPQDDLGHVCADSLAAVGQPALAAIPELGG
jgi:Zn-dependent M28 family amino/carboxypeptidase